MAVFASLFGKLAQRLSPGNVGETLRSHVGAVPNPLSERSKHLQPRIHDAKMVRSVCPYCAVGCGQRVYVKDGKVIKLEKPKTQYEANVTKGEQSSDIIVDEKGKVIEEPKWAKKDSKSAAKGMASGVGGNVAGGAQGRSARRW